MKTAFASLENRNFRRFYIAGIIGSTGWWAQWVAMSWLILDRGYGAAALGAYTGLRFLPLLVLGPWTGTVIDRSDKRRVYAIATSVEVLLSFGLLALVATDSVVYWILLVFALVDGTNLAFRLPVRNAFIPEIVGLDNLRNALGLFSSMNHVSRMVGPAFAAVLLSVVDPVWCFAVNAISLIPAIIVVALMPAAELFRSEPVQREPKQVRLAFTYVRHHREVLAPLVAMLFIGTLMFNFTTTMPILATEGFGKGASGIAAVFLAQSLGSVFGALAAGANRGSASSQLPTVCAVFGLMALVVAVIPDFRLELVALVFLGVAAMTFSVVAHTTIQTATEPHMRGRVMALWTMALYGSTPIGAPIVGGIAQVAGVRWSIALGGLACLAAGLVVRLLLRENAPVTASPVRIEA